MRRFAERIALVSSSLLLLVALEGGLRLAGYGSDTRGALDFGIPVGDDLYVEDAQEPGTMTVSPWVLDMQKGAHRRLINLDRFPRKRPAGELRIIAVGESAVFGYPTGGPMAFPYQLGERVKERQAGMAVDVINMGVPGYDARRVRRVVEEALRYDPSIIILYTGHNEYLRRFTMESLQSLGWQVRLRQTLYRMRLYQLMTRLLRPITGRGLKDSVDVAEKTREMAKREGFSTPRTPFETKLVVDRYRYNIELAIEAAARAKVPLVLCTVVSNVKAYPKRTVYDADVGPEAMARADALRQEIKALSAAEDWKAMEVKVRAALALAPGHAQLHHMLAHALEGQGKLPEAFASYVEAREREATQRRGGTAFNAAIRELGARGGAIVVDLEKLFLADQAHGRWGEGLFSDYCHPTAEGHALIAEEIYRSVDWASLRR